MEHDQEQPQNEADLAIGRRLAKLRERPISTSVFDARLRSMLPVGASQSEVDLPDRWRLSLLLSPMRAAAALLLIALTVAAAIWVFSPNPVLASPQEMAEIHDIAVAQQGHSMSVSTIEEARAALRRQWPNSPQITAPDDLQVLSCCVHEIGKRQMGCVTFEVDGVPVTMAVADAKQVRSPHGEQRIIDGVPYVVGSANGVNMVMSKRGGVWTCVMGRFPLERLAQIAGSFRQ